MSSDRKFNKTAQKAGQFIPEALQHEAPLFEQFLKAYYEWHETQGNTGFEIKNIENSYSYTTAPDSYLAMFKDTFLHDFPALDKDTTKNLLKFARVFYAERGTPESFEFLFKMLWDQDIELKYPSEYILKSSDGHWGDEQRLRVDATMYDGTTFVGKVIKGEHSHSRAFVSAMNFLYKDSVVELILEQVGGDFIIDEKLFIYNDIDEKSLDGVCSVLGTFAEVEIVNPGKGYSANEQLHIKTDGDGYGMILRIAGVDLGTGAVNKINVDNPGVNYMYQLPVFDTQDAYLFDTTLKTREPVQFKIQRCALYNSKGSYKIKKSLLSDDWKLKDNNIYHEFSYIIKSALDPSIYKDTVLKLLHPAGLSMNHEKIYPETAITYIDAHVTQQDDLICILDDTKTDMLVRYSNFAHYNDIMSLYSSIYGIDKSSVRSVGHAYLPGDIHLGKIEAVDELVKNKDEFSRVANPHIIKDVWTVGSNTYDINWYDYGIDTKITEKVDTKIITATPTWIP